MFGVKLGKFRLPRWGEESIMAAPSNLLVLTVVQYDDV